MTRPKILTFQSFVLKLNSEELGEFFWTPRQEVQFMGQYKQTCSNNSFVILKLFDVPTTKSDEDLKT